MINHNSCCYRSRCKECLGYRILFLSSKYIIHGFSLVYPRCSSFKIYLNSNFYMIIILVQDRVEWIDLKIIFLLSPIVSIFIYSFFVFSNRSSRVYANNIYGYLVWDCKIFFNPNFWSCDTKRIVLTYFFYRIKEITHSLCLISFNNGSSYPVSKTSTVHKNYICVENEVFLNVHCNSYLSILHSFYGLLVDNVETCLIFY